MFKIRTFVSLLCFIGMSFCTQVPAFDKYSIPEDLILIASAESRGELLPCNCPDRPLGGLPRRVSLLKEVVESGCPRLLVELGEVFPPLYKMQDPWIWAEGLGAAYGIMGYDLIVFGDEDVKLDSDLLKTFQVAYQSVNPAGKVVKPPENGCGYVWVNLDRLALLDRGPLTSCLVVWSQYDRIDIEQILRLKPANSELNIGLIHGNILAAQGIFEGDSSFDHLIVGNGSSFKELKWIDHTTVSGPGIRGRTLSFIRFLPETKRDWKVVAYRLVTVSPRYPDAVLPLVVQRLLNTAVPR